MPPGPERGIGRVVRDGRAVGLAFCVGDRALLTCAHVVNTALGRPTREAAAPPERARILVEFPFGGEPDDEPVRYATVAMWGPAAGSFDRHDLAGLVLRDDLPAGVAPLHLADQVAPGGTVVQLWGPGRAWEETRGAHVEAVLHGAVEHGRYQIEQRATGTFKADLGYSGGPVWLQADHRVVGVLSAAATGTADGDAYLVGVEVAVAAWPKVLYRPPRCPYRGLDAFGPDDAALFFGRDAVVATLVEHAERLPVVTVMGPSGSGKSSVLAAGLVAAMGERSALAHLTVRPGRDVLTAIATALAARTAAGPVPPAELDAWERRLVERGIGAALHTLGRSVGVDRVVLVLDQFEQILAPEHPADQRDTCLRLLADLTTAPLDPRVLVALSLRHDFLGQLIAGDRDFGPYLQRTAVMLYPPSPAELRAAIVEPALRADPSRPVTVEPGLVAQIVDDFSGQAGELPLVQFALTRLWLRQAGPALTAAAYAELGGARRALTGFADDCVDRLTETAQRAARRIFSRLGLTDGFAVGRRVLRPELPAEDWAVAEQLAGPDARLLVVGWDSGAGTEYVEIAHEILLRAWPRLRDWLKADREFLTWLRSTDSAYRTWQEHGEDGRLLLPEPLLEPAERMVAERGAEVGHLRAFVARSRYELDRDALTGLPNRRALLRSIEEAFKKRQPDQVVAVIELDIARLRLVNQSLGHVAGDRVIAAVGRRLRELAPPAAAVGRTGGDEFGVVIRLPAAAEAERLAEELRGSLHGSFTVEPFTVDLDLIAGIAVHPEHGADPEVLLQRASTATHTARGAGGPVQLFDARAEEQATSSLGLATDLRQALASDGGIGVHYQPILDLQSGRPVSVECLARWNHPAHGRLTPDRFVAIAEQTGQQRRLAETVLSIALRELGAWLRLGDATGLAVNLSPGLAGDAAFRTAVSGLLREHRIRADQLTFELTETAWLGDQVSGLLALREVGARLAIDDFGSGYTSMAHLRRLPVQEIKIDRSFITGVDNSGTAPIVQSIVGLARSLGFTVTGAGIETVNDLNFLRGVGCDRGQGHHISRPLAIEELIRWLEENG